MSCCGAPKEGGGVGGTSCHLGGCSVASELATSASSQVRNADHLGLVGRRLRRDEVIGALVGQLEVERGRQSPRRDSASTSWRRPMPTPAPPIAACTTSGTESNFRPRVGSIPRTPRRAATDASRRRRPGRAAGCAAPGPPVRAADWGHRAATGCTPAPGAVWNRRSAAQTGPVAHAVTDAAVDVLAREIDQSRRGAELQLDLGMQRLEAGRGARPASSRRTTACADRQRAAAAQILDPAHARRSADRTPRAPRATAPGPRRSASAPGSCAGTGAAPRCSSSVRI